jgi:GNAT superfamily N-acetyltransferase
MPRQRRTLEVDIKPLTPALFDDLAEVFAPTPAAQGCWCTWMFSSHKERIAGWGEGNRARFEEKASTSSTPLGMLAYSDEQPIAWCATGPRSRYTSVISPRATIMRGRDPNEDDDVWFVPCFVTRVGFRRSGVTYALLNAAVELAREHGAKAIEGFPIAGDVRGADEYLGREILFQRCGFECIARPSPRRAVMRRDLKRKRSR